MTFILGLDLALARTGYAVLHEEDGAAHTVGEIVTRPDQPLEQRIAFIADTIRRLNLIHEPYATYAEACITVGAQRSTPITIAKVHGAVLVDYGRRGETVGTFTPGEIKKYATGHGHADKGAMVAAAMKRWPPADLPGPVIRIGPWTDNEADALWCAELGRLQIEAAIKEQTT